MAKSRIDWRKALKMTLGVVTCIILVQVAVTVVFVIWLAGSMSSVSRIDVSVVRTEFESSALPNLTSFIITEDKSKSKKDKIFLNISGVGVDAYYTCNLAGFAKVCHIEIDDPALDMEGVRFAEYFWRLHQSEIVSILAKYPNLKLSQDGEIEIDILNKDYAAARGFVRELLEIPDMYNLYRAFKETHHYGNFGNFWVEIYDETGEWLRGGLLLFSWAEENGF